MRQVRGETIIENIPRLPAFSISLLYGHISVLPTRLLATLHWICSVLTPVSISASMDILLTQATIIAPYSPPSIT